MSNIEYGAAIFIAVKAFVVRLTVESNALGVHGVLKTGRAPVIVFDEAMVADSTLTIVYSAKSSISEAVLTF